MSIEARIKEMALTLPKAPKPVGSYTPYVVQGKTVYLSGQLSKKSDGELITGKLGKELKLEQGQEAARIAALNVISILAEIGLDKISRILKLTGYVQTAGNFYDIPQVVNGASNLFLEIWRDNGIHARSAVGMSSLPLNAAVELETVVELKA